MTGNFDTESTSVPINGGQDVTIHHGSPWPSVYRGSKYSLVDSQKRRRDKVVQWKYKDLQSVVEPPSGLVPAMQAVGKSFATGKGSFRVTAGGEVLTKVHADEFPNADQAPHASGWIPVYVGKLTGGMDFDQLNNDPSPPAPSVWDGLSFNHGETWAVGVDDRLIWKRDQFRFESAFDHSELVETYQQYRTVAGRLYINEFGHIWINAPSDSVPDDRAEEVSRIFEKWRDTVEAAGDSAAMRLVDTRLKATAQDGDPENGHLPLYIGHLSEFDDGLIPRPVVTDPGYFVACSKTDAKVVGAY